MSPSRKALQKSSNIKIALGLIGIFGGGRLLPAGEVVQSVVVLTGSVVFIWGCVDFMRSKGYSGWWGALGLIPYLGLIILVLMPNRWVERTPPPTDDNSNYPR